MPALRPPPRRWRLRAVVLACLLATAAGAWTLARRPAAHPVNSHLPWHRAVVDRDGALRPWDERGLDRVLDDGWRFLEQRVPVDRKAHVPVYLAYAAYDEHTLQGTYWQHNPASLYASLVESVVPWYAYSGDQRAVELVGSMLDYQLAHGTTPATAAWPRVPYSTSCGGDRDYGGCFVGLPTTSRAGIAPDKVALLGYGYLRYYELTGHRRYLDAALDCADALARHVRPGDATHTPWPFRVDAFTGRTIGGAEYGGAQVAAVRLFGELVRLHAGPTAAYRRAGALAWRWLLRYPLNPRSADANRWANYYEDMRYDPDNLNQVLPLMTADYLLESPRPAKLDPHWRRDVARLLRWVEQEFGRGPFDGAVAIDEQHRPGGRGCCSPAGLGSDTARWAAAVALYAARTGSAAARRDATRSLGYATYFARGDGRVSCCGDGAFRPAYWFSDGYGDYLGNLSRGLGALPELAPAGEDHLLSSTSVVTGIDYGDRRVVYRTFDRRSSELLRLSFEPTSVTAGGRPAAHTLTRIGGDWLLRVQHDSRVVTVAG